MILGQNNVAYVMWPLLVKPVLFWEGRGEMMLREKKNASPS